MRIVSIMKAEQTHPVRAIVAAVILAICLAMAAPMHAQVVPEGDAGGVILTVGAMGSGVTLQDGDRKMLGITGFVDADTVRRLGFEAEGRWIEFNQTANVHVETYSAGGRYHFDVGRFQPYGKGLIGFGQFNYPYNLATGRFLVITAGGGVDYHLSHRIYIRAADFEYQNWPQFNYGSPNYARSMTSLGVSAGFRVRIF